MGATCAALRFDIAVSMPPRWAAEGGLSGGFVHGSVRDLHCGLSFAHIGGVKATSQMNRSLACSKILAGDLQRLNELFDKCPLFTTNIPEALAPVICRWWTGVLSAKSQGTNNRVAEVALVSIVAVDAQATSAQGADYFVSSSP